MTPERVERLRQVLDRRQPDLTVVTDFVHKQRNLSAIVRVCDAVGIMGIHAVLGEEDYQAFRGTAMGSHHWVEVFDYTSLDSALAPLCAANFQLVGAHPGKDSRDYREVDYTRPTAILLGAERQGLSDESKSRVDVPVSIPMVGMVGSLNVSVASVFCWPRRNDSGNWQDFTTTGVWIMRLTSDSFSSGDIRRCGTFAGRVICAIQC